MDEREALVTFWMGEAPNRSHETRRRKWLATFHAFNAVDVNAQGWKETGQCVVALVVARHADLADVEAQARMWLPQMRPLAELNGLRLDPPAPVFDIMEHTLGDGERYMLAVCGDDDLRLIGARGRAVELRRFSSWGEALGYIQRNHWHDYSTVEE